MKIASVLFADTATHADAGRAANALETAIESKEAGDEVKLIFDGAGTRWIPVYANPEHRSHKQFLALKEDAGACAFCARAFQVDEQIRAAGVPLISEHHGHPSIRTLLADGFQVVTF